MIETSFPRAEPPCWTIGSGTSIENPGRLIGTIRRVVRLSGLDLVIVYVAHSSITKTGKVFDTLREARLFLVSGFLVSHLGKAHETE